MIKEDEDKLLFSRVKQGNKEAFDTLFRKYYIRLVRFAIGYVKSGPIAEEIIQDIFIKFWEYAKRIEIESSLLAYMYSSSRNACLNYIKKEDIRAKYEMEKHEQAKEKLQNTQTEVNVSAFQELLAIHVGNLPEKCRQIFELSKFEGLSYDEIAAFLDISSKTVENQMGIALRKLREALSPYRDLIYE